MLTPLPGDRDAGRHRQRADLAQHHDSQAPELFTTSVDGQTVVDLHVVQGERERPRDCRSLARFEAARHRSDAGRDAQIEMTFLIDANGILQVTAREVRTGEGRAAIECARPTDCETDVARMVDESFTYAEADVEARLLIEARTEADTVLTHVERALRQAGALSCGRAEHHRPCPP
jgi:molecular chaperone DnaK/molecular chaperone HscA